MLTLLSSFENIAPKHTRHFLMKHDHEISSLIKSKTMKLVPLETPNTQTRFYFSQIIFVEN